MKKEMEKTYTVTESQLRKFVQRGWNLRAGYSMLVAEPVTIANIDSAMEDGIKELDENK